MSVDSSRQTFKTCCHLNIALNLIMKTLYILGNGFDLYHRLGTRYSDFHKFVMENDEELEEKLANYFQLELDGNYLWCNFEANLSTYQSNTFFDDHNQIDIFHEKFKPSECFGLEDDINQDVEELVENLREQFRNWISEIDFDDLPINAYQPIVLENNAIFINFNYTDTLEEIYKIPNENILYIHNNANRYEDLIFGHGEPIEDEPAENELDENGDSNRTMFTDAQNSARIPFYDLKKNTEEVIREHKTFFSKIENLETIYILGHSLGKVDWPYFELIASLSPTAVWHISYYLDQERQNHASVATNHLGIPNSRVRMIRLDDLISS